MITMVKQFIAVFFYVVFNVPVETNQHLHVARFRPELFAGARVAQVKDTIGPAEVNAMRLHKDQSLRRYTFLFEGKATLKGKPCPGASVLVRVTTSQAS